MWSAGSVAAMAFGYRAITASSFFFAASEKLFGMGRKRWQHRGIRLGCQPLTPLFQTAFWADGGARSAHAADVVRADGAPAVRGGQRERVGQIRARGLSAAVRAAPGPP